MSIPRAPDVLVVDDDPTAIAGIRAALIDAGHEVAVARSGTDAIHQVATLQPRLMILDVAMPGMDGLGVCRWIKSNADTAHLPILFLSSSATTPSRLAGFDAGGVDFLAKPFEPAELLARVHAHLGLAQLREGLAEHNKQISRAHRELHFDLQAAGRIQRAMLPQPETVDPRVRFAWRCIQCDHLGGDAINIMRLGKDCYAFYVLDASGHGTPASLLAVATGYFIAALYGEPAEASMHPRSPASVLNSVNRVLSKMDPNGAFVTVICGTIDLTSSQLTFAAAGHPGPLLLRSHSSPIFLDRPAPPAGLGEWQYEDRSVPLEPRDRVLLYSDGLYEQRGTTGDRLNRDQLMTWAAQSATAPIQDAANRILTSFDQWRGGRPVDDDLLLLAIDYVGDNR